MSELGLVTSGGKVVWGKYAQITNNPVSPTNPHFDIYDSTPVRFPLDTLLTRCTTCRRTTDASTVFSSSDVDFLLPLFL